MGVRTMSSSSTIRPRKAKDQQCNTPAPLTIKSPRKSEHHTQSTKEDDLAKPRKAIRGARKWAVAGCPEGWVPVGCPSGCPEGAQIGGPKGTHSGVPLGAQAGPPRIGVGPQAGPPVGP